MKPTTPVHLNHYAYRALLRFYPASFRDEFAAEMREQQQRRRDRHQHQGQHQPAEAAAEEGLRHRSPVRPESSSRRVGVLPAAVNEPPIGRALSA